MVRKRRNQIYDMRQAAIENKSKPVNTAIEHKSVIEHAEQN